MVLAKKIRPVCTGASREKNNEQDMDNQNDGRPAWRRLHCDNGSFSGTGGLFRKRATGMVVRKVERQLQITDAQRAQIKDILAAEKPAIQALFQQVEQQNRQLAGHQTFDEAYIRTFAQQHASTTSDVLVEREKVRIEILQVLTPEQRQRLEQMRLMRTNQLMDRLSSLG